MRTKLSANVPKNKNTARIAEEPACTGFGFEGLRAKLARNVPIFYLIKSQVVIESMFYT